LKVFAFVKFIGEQAKLARIKGVAKFDRQEEKIVVISAFLWMHILKFFGCKSCLLNRKMLFAEEKT
jgi:hypothetical protein